MSVGLPFARIVYQIIPSCLMSETNVKEVLGGSYFDKCVRIDVIVHNRPSLDAKDRTIFPRPLRQENMPRSILVFSDDTWQVS